MLPTFLVSCLAFLRLNGICELDSSQYLNVPSSEEVESERATFGPIEESLGALAHTSGANSLAIIKRANELKARQRDDYGLATLNMIEALNDKQVSSCTPELATSWLRAYAVIRAKQSEKLRAVGEYLLQRGRYKFLACAKWADADFREVTLGNQNSRLKVAKFLDNADRKFLSSVWTLRFGELRSVQSYELVENYKSQRLRQFVEGRTMGEKGVVSAYLTRMCNYIKHTIGEQFQMINLGRALASYELKNPYLARVNEYYRIFCVESQRPEVKKYLDAMETRRGPPNE